ncbi:MAG: NAD(P)-dependent oxidoreductase [Candidatus Diapherotrites archaeon]|uniref:NAD(P)-dependent oxidoreductase n=1 Tax=Candidatus Iainarchaeum sp. TaxID=3101447 RepID=A0A938YVQ8_9ARCH|nr:NAD(P)-dependent oxidoreductase [Candidatus Diapherotrites archaeon]
MNILVTGSNGFVGKRLVQALNRQGHNVKEFDLSLGNDITDLGQCKQAVKGIDVVYHLAAVLDEESAQLEKANVKGTENILEAAAKQRCRQLIYLSTVGVHGNCKARVDEKASFAPVTNYEKSKAKAEQIAQEFQEMVPITVLRAALALGPNEYWKQIIKLVKKGFPLIGGGKQVWQTIYIDDLVDALLFVLGKEACFGETFIVAEQEQHSLRELYAEIQRQLGMEVKVKTVPVAMAKLGALLYKLKGRKSIIKAEHIDRLARTRNYNTGKLNALGWKAKTEMQEAVKRTVEGLNAY